MYKLADKTAAENKSSGQVKALTQPNRIKKSKIKKTTTLPRETFTAAQRSRCDSSEMKRLARTRRKKKKKAEIMRKLTREQLRQGSAVH